MRLPDEFRFTNATVSDRKEGEAVILEPVKSNIWSAGCVVDVRSKKHGDDEFLSAQNLFTPGPWNAEEIMFDGRRVEFRNIRIKEL